MIDTHCHILPKYGYTDLSEIINNAKNAGINKMICIGCQFEDFDETFEATEKYPNIIYCAIGLHPENIKEDSNINKMFEDFKRIVLNNKDKIFAIGECGLDYHFSDNKHIHKMQQELFLKHLELCIELQKPIIIHTRDVWEDTFRLLDEISFKTHLQDTHIIKDQGNSFPNMDISLTSGIVHSFTGNITQAQECIKRGFKVGINGIVTFKKSADIREAVKYIGLNNIVLETDSPFLTPEPYRGKVNEPAHIKEIAYFITDLVK